MTRLTIYAVPVLALAAPAAVMPTAAWAYSGLGCTNLPAYDRAVGALQGMPGACDMTIAEAKRIVAAHDQAYGVPQVAPAHRARSPQQ